MQMEQLNHILIMLDAVEMDYKGRLNEKAYLKYRKERIEKLLEEETSGD